jgi:hypothetical protein
MSPFTMWETSWPNTASASPSFMTWSNPVLTAIRALLRNIPVANAFGSGELKTATSGIPIPASRAALCTVSTNHRSTSFAGLSITLAPVARLATHLEMASEKIAPPKPNSAHVARTMLAGFLGYAFSQTLGFSLVTGGSLRYRLYSAWGLSAAEIAELIAVAGARRAHRRGTRLSAQYGSDQEERVTTRCPRGLRRIAGRQHGLCSPMRNELLRAPRVFASRFFTSRRTGRSSLVCQEGELS